MQIRLATRQDEKAIVELVVQVMEEFGMRFDLNGIDSDLKNIQSSYFEQEGLFLLAEHERKIAGVASARCGAQENLELTRIAVLKPWRRQGVAGKMLKIIFDFGKRMSYSKILVEPARQYSGSTPVLMSCGFTSEPVEDAQPVWYYNLNNWTGKLK